jgi:hypothetical protein
MGGNVAQAIRQAGIAMTEHITICTRVVGSSKQKAWAKCSCGWNTVPSGNWRLVTNRAALHYAEATGQPVPPWEADENDNRTSQAQRVGAAVESAKGKTTLQP